jgi:CRISPR-associated protein Cst1
VRAQLPVMDIQRTLVLTPHPLQRVGAFALAELVGIEHPDLVRPEQFDQALRFMTQQLLSTAEVETSKEANGFWLGVSYLLWPNSAMNPTNRKKLLPAQRRERITQWRALPDPAQWPGAPCSLCGRLACGYYGKVDVPLGASTAYRNTTPRDHAGLALCFACVSSFHALPYGCQIGGGRAAALHSWDEDFLQRSVIVQVGRTRREAMVGAQPTGASPYWREVAALRHLRSHPRRLSAGVQLIVFSNSNKEQVLDEHAMDQPLAEWLRSTARDRQRARGFRYLVRAHRGKEVPGTSMLARRAFRTPEHVLTRAARFLRAVAAEASAVPGEVVHLVPLVFSYAIEVLQVNDKDVGRIRQLAEHISQTLTPHRERGVLKGYESAHRESRRLQEWLRKRAVSWTLSPPDDRSEPFVTSEQWRLLFDPDDRGPLHRDLLFIAVLEQLHQHGWRADDAGARDDLDDDIIDDLIAEEDQ